MRDPVTAPMAQMDHDLLNLVRANELRTVEEITARLREMGHAVDEEYVAVRLAVLAYRKGYRRHRLAAYQDFRDLVACPSLLRPEDGRHAGPVDQRAVERGAALPSMSQENRAGLRAQALAAPEGRSATCKRCGRVLTSTRSRSRHVGPGCYRARRREAGQARFDDVLTEVRA